MTSELLVHLLVAWILESRGALRFLREKDSDSTVFMSANYNPLFLVCNQQHNAVKFSRSMQNSNLQRFRQLTHANREIMGVQNLAGNNAEQDFSGN